MMRTRNNKFKEGAASFYVVAIATLILVILVTSFIAIIVSEVTRTSNDDLSQSAYDSALAGIEDAKLAYYNYQKCKEQGATAQDPSANIDGSLTCGNIIWYMEHPDCDMVGHILGRIPKGEEGEVLIEEKTVTGAGGENSMEQAYTCNKITTSLLDYRSTLNESNTTRVVYVKLGEGIAANQIGKVKISWYSNTDGAELAYTNFSVDKSSGSGSGVNKVVFPQLRLGGTGSTRAATPPTISVGLVQTGTTFKMEDFEKVDGDRTNRGTVYLVPTESSSAAERSQSTAYSKSEDYAGNYIGTWNGYENIVTAGQIVKSNDHAVKNLPFAVYCGSDSNSDFVCSTTLMLPDVLSDDGSGRSSETFMFVVSIPYGQPSTDFALEFYCMNGKKDVMCGKKISVSGEGETVEDTNQANLEGVQVNIDSTGRANNLYRRVEARLETSTVYFPYPLYAIELLGEGGGSLLTKPDTVTCEYDFEPVTCR